MSETVSVVVPVYNGEKYLAECVESILSQSYQDLELIVVDDGSTDKTLTILEEYRRKDSRLQILRVSNGGPELARVRGLSLVRNDGWLMFVDADDYLIGKDILQRLTTVGNQNHADVVCFDYFYRNQKGFHIEKACILECTEALGNMLHRTLLDGNMWCKLYRTKIVKEQKGEILSNKHFCDFVSTGHILEHSKRIWVEPICGYYYRDVVKSLSRNNQCHPREEEYEEGARSYYQYITRRYPSIKAYAEYNWLMALIYVCIKFEKDINVRRSDIRFSNYKKHFRNCCKELVHNRLIPMREKVQYFLCYFDLFRTAYRIGSVWMGKGKK